MNLNKLINTLIVTVSIFSACMTQVNADCEIAYTNRINFLDNGFPDAGTIAIMTGFGAIGGAVSGIDFSSAKANPNQGPDHPHPIEGMAVGAAVGSTMVAVKRIRLQHDRRMLQLIREAKAGGYGDEITSTYIEMDLDKQDVSIDEFRDAILAGNESNAFCPYKDLKTPRQAKKWLKRYLVATHK